MRIHRYAWNINTNTHRQTRNTQIQIQILCLYLYFYLRLYFLPLLLPLPLIAAGAGDQFVSSSFCKIVSSIQNFGCGFWQNYFCPSSCPTNGWKNSLCVWRASMRISSQPEITGTKHFLIFSSSNFNYMFWGMMEKEWVKKIKNWSFILDL